MPLPKKTILLDTNCFLRIYLSPALPVFGAEIAGYRILTLEKLIQEFLKSPALVEKYPRAAIPPKVNDLKDGALILTEVNKKRVIKQKGELEPYAKLLIGSLKAKKLDYSQLSPADLDLLATVVVIRGVMATDERALTIVAENLIAEDPNEYPISVMTSMEILALFEKNGGLTSEQRRATVRWWMKDGQKLPSNWRLQYSQLFEESAEELDD